MDLFAKDLEAHAKTLTELTLHTRDNADRTGKVEQAQAVQAAEDRLQRQMLHQEITALTARVDAIYKLGWWIFAAFGTGASAIIIQFVVRGGLIVK